MHSTIKKNNTFIHNQDISDMKGYIYITNNTSGKQTLVDLKELEDFVIENSKKIQSWKEAVSNWSWRHRNDMDK